MSNSKNWFLGVHLGDPRGRGTPKLCQNNCLLNIYWYQKKVELYLEPFKKLIFGGSIWGSPRGGWHSQTMSKYLSVEYLLISKRTSTDIKKRTLPWAVQKIDFWGSIWGSPRGGWHPQTMSKYLSVEYLLISKRTSTLAWAVQKIDFLGPHFGGVAGGVVPKNFGRKNCICSSTTLHKN